MNIKAFSAAAAALALSGCFTVYQTPYPETSIRSSKDGGPGTAVQISGFEATVTTFVPVYGYGTVVGRVPGPYRRHGYIETTTIATETYIPRAEQTPEFRDRAAEALEMAGFNLQTTNPVYRVDVRFVGPSVSNTDRTVSFLWNILSILSADYGTQTWTAKLKIYEIATGKLAFYKDYTQKYQVAVWGPIPLLSPSGATDTSYNAMQSWTLSALTDIAVSDAAAFLASAPARR